MAAKRQYALQRAQSRHGAAVPHLDRYGYDDVEPEEEVRPYFPCPYCYEDHDITSLCAHLEDEHPFENKVVACPVCSARVSKDLERSTGDLLEEAEDTAKSFASAVVENNWFKRTLPPKTWKTSSDSNLSQEEKERRRRRAVVRSSFVQHLLVSTLFDD
ncbi:hypothetical protein GUJ93_ZPchr0006g44211 [Zizania palustris]|uniref:Drought induced 19 protein type zinc-binding domain-containing protein n=1 Tax=Zizania palustris TaxID=103762 RepID=A0A8J5SZI0_ZIZPA|nr:hypothetical protein GUJ93_ZPchr0006g44211 [Zizania palustris]